MYRLLREIRPRWVICENVAGHVELGLDSVLSDMENAGYTAMTFIIPACAVGAPHRRDRVWIVAYARRIRLVTSPAAQFIERLSCSAVRWELPAPFTVGSTDGIPCALDRIRGLGNAVVPQIPETIGKAIIAYDRMFAR
jgi:DNA (cytosine-5)-methyltransferase 1